MQRLEVVAPVERHVVVGPAAGDDQRQFVGARCARMASRGSRRRARPDRSDCSSARISALPMPFVVPDSIVTADLPFVWRTLALPQISQATKAAASDATQAQGRIVHRQSDDERADREIRAIVGNRCTNAADRLWTSRANTGRVRQSAIRSASRRSAPMPSRASRAAIRASSRSFSSRAFSAIALTTSNSSRRTTSMPLSTRSPCDLHDRLDLTLHPLRGAGGICHQAREVVENTVVGLRHGGSPSIFRCLICADSARGIQAPPRRGRILERQPLSLILTTAVPGRSIPSRFEIGPIAVKWYGLAYMAGLLLGWLYIKRLLSRTRALAQLRTPPFEPERADDLLLFMTVGVIVGGRLGSILFYEPGYYLRNPAEIPQVWRGGMAFHGALIGTAHRHLAVLARRTRPRCGAPSTSCAAAVPLGLFFGRLANFINGELWGRPTDVPWAMVFPDAGPAPRHPSQLYEAALEGLVLFLVLRVLTHRKLALKSPGLVTGVFLAGYGLARSFCEFFREPDAQHAFTVGPLTPGIVYSIPMIAARRVADPCGPRRHGRWRRELRSEQPGARRPWRRTLAAEIARDGPMPVRRVHAALPVGPASTATMRRVEPLGRCRRLHHRARDQPDLRRADRAVGRGGLARRDGARRRRSRSPNSVPAVAR